MAEEVLDSVSGTVPGTPGITEVRSEHQSHLGAEEGGGNPVPGIRRVNLRAVIDTSPPFESVKEAVTRFGGSGPWIPYGKLADNYNDVEEFDIKRVEERTTELEKDLIVKELETLDVLEELGTTKRMVEELKLQLKNESLKRFSTPNFHIDEQSLLPTIKEMNKESYNHPMSPIMLGSSSPCPVSSPEMILMELKQAKLNLGKTINDLGAIQTSVKFLNKKMRKEKNLLEKNQSVSTLEEQLKQIRVVKPPQLAHDEKTISIPASKNTSNNTGLRTAELKWVAAKKMEEAAQAAEAVALAEIEALTSCGSPAGFSLTEPEKISFNFKPEAMVESDEAKTSRIAVVNKLKEATEEVTCSKQALEEALNRIEAANRRQFVAEEALRKWTPEQAVYYSLAHNQDSSSPLNGLKRSDRRAHNEVKPVLRSNISMRDVLSRKQIGAGEGYAVAGGRRDGHGERQKVALSQMLDALREDLSFPSKQVKDGNHDHDHHNHHNQKQYVTERKKFGFIHISLSKPSKKKTQPLNLNSV